MAKLTAELLDKSTTIVGVDTQRIYEVRRLIGPKYQLVVLGRGTYFSEKHVVAHLSVVFWLLKELYLVEGAEESKHWLPFEEAAVLENMPAL